MNIYREVVAYINSYRPGTTFTTKDFHKYMASLGYRDSYQPHYRINTYRTYLSSAGFIIQVRRGVWATVYVIPEWVTLKMLETARGYGTGCNKVIMREAQDKIAAYFHDIDSKLKQAWKIGDRFMHKRDIVTIYTIAKDLGSEVLVNWPDFLSGTTYSKKTVDENVASGLWKIVEDKDVPSMDLQINQSTHNLQTMRKVSTQLILDGYESACKDWQTKLEDKFPTLFKKATSTLKIGSIVNIDCTKYIIAQCSSDSYTAISLTSGNRWSDPVEFKGETSEIYKNGFTIDQARLILNSKLNHPDSIFTFEDGSSIFPKLIMPGWTYVDDDFIKEAYEKVVDKNIKDRIQSAVPELFGPQYIRLTRRCETSGKELPFSVGTAQTKIDGVRFIIGQGLAPDNLENRCLLVKNAIVKVQKLENGYTCISFEKE